MVIYRTKGRFLQVGIAHISPWRPGLRYQPWRPNWGGSPKRPYINRLNRNPDFFNDTLLMPSHANYPHQSAQQMFEDLVEARALNFNQVRSEG